MSGPPPIPAEIKRRRGNPGKRRLPALRDVQALPMAVGIPDPPDELGEVGWAMWTAVWEAARPWLSPIEAHFEVLWLCQGADERAQLRRLVMLGADERNRRDLRQLEKHMTMWASNLGFSPAARVKLGLELAKTETALDTLRKKHR